MSWKQILGDLSQEEYDRLHHEDMLRAIEKVMAKYPDIAGPQIFNYVQEETHGKVRIPYLVRYLRDVGFM